MTDTTQIEFSSKKVVIYFIGFFILTIASDFMYQNFSFGVKNSFNQGLFYLGKNILFFLLLFGMSKDIISSKIAKILFVPLAALLFSIPYFLDSALIKLDYENLIPKAIIGSLVGFFFVKDFSFKALLLFVLFGTFAVLKIRLGSDFNYEANLLYAFNKIGISQFLLPSGFLFDWGNFFILALSTVSLFYILHSLLGISLSYPTDNLKGILIDIFILKTVSYTCLAGFLIVMLGNSTFPLFSNKVALFIAGVTFIIFEGFLIQTTILKLIRYFKLSKSELPLSYFLLCLPFVDVLSILALTLSKDFINIKISRISFLLLLSSCLITNALLQYFLSIKNLPNSVSDLKYYLILNNILLPFLILAIIILVKKANFRIISLFILFLIFASLSIIKTIPIIETFGSFIMLLNSMNLILHSFLFAFFISPVLHQYPERS